MNCCGSIQYSFVLPYRDPNKGTHPGSRMNVKLDSSAPHIHPALEWHVMAPNENNLILYKSADGDVEVGIRRWPQRNETFFCESDCLCYFQRGRGVFRGDTGESIALAAGTAVHFKQGWRGMLEPSEPLEASYMTCAGGPSDRTPVMRDVLAAAPLKDWGAIPTMNEGTSLTAGILLSREPNGRAESGIWTCTPGLWQCEVTSDEYCHFLDGSCTYTHESGETIEIEPDTLAFFPRGWKGPCNVRRTMRKVYMIR
jgi:uncharacterized cupin superfamily protein